MPFANGDLFVGVGYGRWNHFNAQGQLLATLDNGHDNSPFTDHSTAGACFDAAGNMYGTDFADSSVSKFTNSGGLIDESIADLDAHPEACLVLDDALFVSLPYGTGDIVKLALDGKETDRYDVERSDWIDLGSDHCTMYYTDEGPVIHRHDICKDQALPDFASPGGENFALRLLPDQSLLVASDEAIKHLSPTGTVLAQYSAPDEDSFFSLNLDPDGQHFWSAALNGTQVYEFAISPAGPPVKQFDGRVDLGAGKKVAGLALYGEPTASHPLQAVATGGIDLLLWLLILAIVVAAVVLLLFVWQRRRRARTVP